jgi:sulfur-oxidizing protein SoxX
MRNRFQDISSRCGRALAGVTTLAALLLVLVQPAAGSSDIRVAEGKKLAMERNKGNCLACHVIEDGKLPGNVGPPLLAMKVRFPSREVLKEQICDATLRNPNSRMPPFCRHGILTENEVEMIVDYLYTL